MTIKHRGAMAAFLIGALSVSLASCQRSETNTATATSTTTTTTTTSSTSAAQANIPSECQAYLTAVQACVDRVSQSNPAVATQVRQSMDQTRASWAAVTDQAALAQTCTAARNAFNSSSSAMGC